jgi:hypothetical protein
MRLVTYADDLVILCRMGKAEAALQSLREIMGQADGERGEDAQLQSAGRRIPANRLCSDGPPSSRRNRSATEYRRNKSESR